MQWMVMTLKHHALYTIEHIAALGKPQKDTASTMRQSCMQKSGLWFYTNKYKSQVTVFEHN